MTIAALTSNQINPATDFKDKLNEVIAALNTLDPVATAAAVADLEAWRATGVATDTFAGASETATVTEGIITGIA